MKSLWLDEGKVRVVIIVFSIIGLIVLAIVSFTSGIERAPISELPSHIGQTVEVTGTVVGAVHHRSGLTEALVHDEGRLLFLDIERSTRELSPNDVVTVRGQPFLYGDEMRMSVSTDRTMGHEKGDDPPVFDPSNIGYICKVQGIVISSEGYGKYGYNLSVECLLSSGDRFTAWAMVLKGSDAPSAGDGIEAVGLHVSREGLVCFGEGAMTIMYEADTMDTTLLEIVASEPGAVPRDPLTFECYLRYTPKGRSMFLGESPEGASLSVKAVLTEPVTGMCKGDLVRLANCSLEWDPSAMRYDVLPSGVVLVKPHGPWALALASLPYGVGDYEGCAAALSGEVVLEGDRYLVRDGNSTLEVRGGGPSGPATGIIRFDIARSIYYLDRETSP